MKHDMFYAKQRCKKTQNDQLLRGSWRNATSMCMDCCKFIVISKLLYNKREQI